MRKFTLASALGALATTSLITVSCTVGDASDPVEEGPVLIMGQGAIATYIPGVDPDGRAVGLIDDMVVELVTDEHARVLGPDEDGLLGVTGVTDPNRLWPGGVVPYRIAPNLAGDHRIPEAIAHFEERTNLVFVPWSGQPAVLDFTDDHHKQIFLFNIEIKNCFAQVGRFPQIPGRSAPSSTFVHIARRFCPSTGTVIHEIGHAIGLMHTHQREDRDQHVRVHWDRIPWEWERNFTRLHGRWIQNGGDDDAVWHQPFRAIGPYETSSFMHYGSYGKASGGKPWLTRLDGSTFSANRRITDNDAASINKLYESAPADYPPPPPDDTP